MKDQVLSIEQMKHLKDLGVDTSRASLTWMLHPYEEGKQPVLAFRRWCTFKEPFRKAHCVPAFTLQDMLEMIPQNIKGYTLYVSKSATAYLSIWWSPPKVFGKEGILTHTYNMLCWIAENNLLTEEEKK